jgi:CubicO group peptidase (beta-lactamase class C family)
MKTYPRRRLPPFLLFACLLANDILAQTTPAELSARVDAVFASMNNSNSPGCAVGVISNGEFVHKAAYGMANLELDVALSTDSIFRIASVSKQFTASAVLLLADEGLIDLDEDIRSYLPDLVDYGATVTVRSMLGHVSGIPDYEEGIKLRSAMGGEFRIGNEDYLSIDEFYRVAKNIKLSQPPMTSFEYSNTAYFLLSQLVERVSGLSLREYSQKNIFNPLGMEHSFFSDDGTEIIKQRATGYVLGDEGHYITDMTNLYWVGDGGVHTSIDDFLFWDRNFYHPKLGKDPAAFIEALNTPNSKLKSDEYLYANGQFIRDQKGQPNYRHTGGWLGFSTYYLRYPALQLSVVTFCNDANAQARAMGNETAEIFGGPGANN